MRQLTVVVFLVFSLLLPWTVSAEEKKAADDHRVSITGMQFLTDTGDEAIVIINGAPSDRRMSSKEELITKEGKDWLRIRLTPASLGSEKNVRLESELIGEVRLEKDPDDSDTVIISLELLPEMLTYSVNNVKNSSNVMVTVTKLGGKTAQPVKP